MRGPPREPAWNAGATPRVVQSAGDGSRRDAERRRDLRSRSAPRRSEARRARVRDSASARTVCHNATSISGAGRRRYRERRLTGPPATGLAQHVASDGEHPTGRRVHRPHPGPALPRAGERLVDRVGGRAAIARYDEHGREDPPVVLLVPVRESAVVHPKRQSRTDPEILGGSAREIHERGDSCFGEGELPARDVDDAVLGEVGRRPTSAGGAQRGCARAAEARGRSGGRERGGDGVAPVVPTPAPSPRTSRPARTSFVSG